MLFSLNIFQNFLESSSNFACMIYKAYALLMHAFLLLTIRFVCQTNFLTIIFLVMFCKGVFGTGTRMGQKKSQNRVPRKLDPKSPTPEISDIGVLKIPRNPIGFFVFGPRPPDTRPMFTPTKKLTEKIKMKYNWYY